MGRCGYSGVLIVANTYRNAAGLNPEDVYDPDVIGDGPTAQIGGIGYRVAGGVLLKFAKLSYGTAAPNHGCRLADGRDFSALWAKKGTAVYTLPINGGSYTASRNTRGDAKLVFNMKNDGTYSVVRSLTGSSDSTLASGTWLPSGGVVGGYKCAFTVTVGSNTTSGGGNNSTANSAVTSQSLSTSQSASATSQSILVGDMAEQFVTVVMRLYTSAGALLSTTTIYFHCVSDGNS